MDLFDFSVHDRLDNVKTLLGKVAGLIKVIDSPDTVGLADSWLHSAAHDTFLVTPGGTMDKPRAFPRLLAAFEAMEETVATPAQKKRKGEHGYNYNLTNFLSHMSQDQRRELKLALQADAMAIIAIARSNATDGTPKLFDGVPLPSGSTAEVRQALDALFQTAQEQLNALRRRIAALNDCDEVLNRIDGDLLAADNFSRDVLPQLAGMPPPTIREKVQEEKRAAKREKH